MKLLFDQNLSPKLAKYFEEHFNASQHVQDTIKAFINDLDNGILSIF